jgi:hypothetical protein
MSIGIGSENKNDGKVENCCAGKDQPDEDPF